MRSARNNALRGAAHLVQLGHQIRFSVQASGGINDYVVHFAGLRGLQGIVQDGGGIASLLRLDNFCVATLAPDFELLNGCSPEGVGGAEQDGFAVGTKNMGQLADGRCLSRAVYADD